MEKGLDLARLTDKREFAFIDGLSQLFFTPAPETTVSSTLPASVQSVRLSSRMSLPIRPQPDAIPSQSSPIASNLNPSRASPACKQLHFSSSNPTALDALETDVASVIESLRKPSMKDGEQVEDETEVLLVIDQPDLFLAATGPGKGLGATEMGNWVMGLRQVCRISKYAFDFQLLLLIGMFIDTACLRNNSHTVCRFSINTCVNI